MRGSDLLDCMRDAGAAAVPIVTIVNGLVGGILAFVGAQPGALYVVYQTTNSTESAVLTAPYTGPTNTQSSWNVGAG